MDSSSSSVKNRFEKRYVEAIKRIPQRLIHNPCPPIFINQSESEKFVSKGLRPNWLHTLRDSKPKITCTNATLLNTIQGCGKRRRSSFVKNAFGGLNRLTSISKNSLNSLCQIFLFSMIILLPLISSLLAAA